MTNVALGEAGIAQPHNAVEVAVAQAFPAELWSQDIPVRLRVGNITGLDPVFYSSHRRSSDRKYPEREWAALLYGTRIASGGGDQPIEFENVPLEVMPQIHEHIARTVLADEHARPSRLTVPPVPSEKYLIESPLNSIFWLEQIAGGYWPIMSYKAERVRPGGPELGETVYFEHDYSDYHNAIMMTLPRESQGLLTRVAQYELDWLRGRVDTNGEVMPDRPKVLELPGDTYRDPYNAGLGERGAGEYMDGMWLIDSITDRGSHILLLHYLMHDPRGATPEERLQTLEMYILAGKPGNDSVLSDTAESLTFMRDYQAAMANFVARHERGRNITGKEEQAMFRDYLRGTLRVAKKIAGEWTTDDELADRLHRSRRAAIPAGRVATA